MTTDFTRRIAEFIVDTDTADIPAAVKDAVVRPVLDTIGVVMASTFGGNSAATTAIGYADAIAPAGAGRLWSGLPSGLPPETTAMLTSTMGHALDYDDELAGTGHPSSILVSAILALPLAALSGADMIDAFAIGYETNVKVANAIGHQHYWKGWHTTATVGGFGSLGAAARLLKLDLHQTETAIGIVASLAGGLQRNFGTMTKPLHSGLAARNGVLAAMLAAAGLTASTDVLDGPRGFIDIYANGGEVLESFDRLANPWAILDPGPTLKKYPCCYATHRPLDAVLKLTSENGITPDKIAKIVDRAPTKGLHPLIYPHAVTGLQGKFSMTYVLAAGVLDGKVTLDTFTDEKVNRPEIRRLMALVDAQEDPRCRPEDPQALHSGAGTGGFHEVTIVTTDGREFTHTVDYPSGSPKHPLSWEESAAKWDDCLTVGDRDLEKGAVLRETLRRLPEVDDVHAALAAMAE